MVCLALARADQAARDYQTACDQVAELLADDPDALRAWLAGEGE